MKDYLALWRANLYTAGRITGFIIPWINILLRLFLLQAEEKPELPGNLRGVTGAE